MEFDVSLTALVTMIFNYEQPATLNMIFTSFQLHYWIGQTIEME